MQRMWEKLVHLSTAATMTCLMRANVGEIVGTPDGGRLFLELLDDVSRISSLSGYEPSAEFIKNYRQVFSDASSAYATSMLRDMERRSPLAKAPGFDWKTFAGVGRKSYGNQQGGRGGTGRRNGLKIRRAL